MRKVKMLLLFVHCVLTLLLAAPFFWGLYSTALFGTTYTEARAISAFMLLSVAIMLNCAVLRACENTIREFLGDGK